MLEASVDVRKWFTHFIKRRLLEEKESQMKVINVILLSVGSLLVTSPMSALADVVRLGQNFDDTAIFDASETASRTVGDLNTTGGSWTLDPNATNGPWVANDGSDVDRAHGTEPVFSATQSLGFSQAAGGSTVRSYGRVNNGVSSASDYELSFMLHKTDVFATFTMDVTGFNPTVGGVADMSLLVASDGLFLWSGSAWIDSGLDISSNVWTNVRLEADVTGTGTYNVFATPDGGSEIAGGSAQSLLMTTREDIRQLHILRAGSVDKMVYLDDIELTEVVVPEPAALGLLSVGGLMMLARRKRSQR